MEYGGRAEAKERILGPVRTVSFKRIVGAVLVEVAAWSHDQDTLTDSKAAIEKARGILGREVLEDVGGDHEVVPSSCFRHRGERLDRFANQQLVVQRALEVAEVRRIAFDPVDDDRAGLGMRMPRKMRVLAREKAHSSATDADVQNTLRL
jgi:hypothetical protein